MTRRTLREDIEFVLCCCLLVAGFAILGLISLWLLGLALTVLTGA